MEVILGALLIAGLFTALIAFGYEGERNWGGLGLFFLLFFLPIWALALWIPAVGPVWYGIAWLDFIAFALILSFFILAITPTNYRKKHPKFERDVSSLGFSESGGEYTATMRSYSAAFWGFVAFIIVAILLGSARAQDELNEKEPVVLISTLGTAQKTGCWAILYDEPGLDGEQITLYDGVDLPELNVGEASWTGRVRSITTGPKARLILYGEKFWKDMDYTILPATQLESLRKMPWNYVKSLRLQCIP